MQYLLQSLNNNDKTIIFKNNIKLQPNSPTTCGIDFAIVCNSWRAVIRSATFDVSKRLVNCLTNEDDCNNDILFYSICKRISQFFYILIILMQLSFNILLKNMNSILLKH